MQGLLLVIHGQLARSSMLGPNDLMLLRFYRACIYSVHTDNTQELQGYTQQYLGNHVEIERDQQVHASHEPEALYYLSDY